MGPNERQVDLLGPTVRGEGDLLRKREEVACDRERVVIVVLALGVDLGAGPAEDAEGVVGAEVDEGEGEVAGAGAPRGGLREEEVSDEVVVRGGRRGIDGEEVEVGGGRDAGPAEIDGGAGGWEGGWRGGEGGFGFSEVEEDDE